MDLIIIVSDDIPVSKSRTIISFLMQESKGKVSFYVDP